MLQTCFFLNTNCNYPNHTPISAAATAFISLVRYDSLMSVPVLKSTAQLHVPYKSLTSVCRSFKITDKTLYFESKCYATSSYS